MITNAGLWVAAWTLIGEVAAAAIILGAVLWAGFTIKIGSVKENVEGIGSTRMCGKAWSGLIANPTCAIFRAMNGMR